MSDITYTAQGGFSGNTIDLKFCLPPNDPNNSYKFKTYDLSTLNTNAILVHLIQTSRNFPLSWLSTQDLLTRPSFSAADKKYQYSTGFDFNKKDALIIVFHEDLFDETYLPAIFSEIDKMYNFTDDENGDIFSGEWPPYSSLKEKSSHKFFPFDKDNIVPKRVGLTIVRKY